MNEFTTITQPVGSEFYVCYVDDPQNKWEYELINNDKDGYQVITYVSLTHNITIDEVNHDCARFKVDHIDE